MATANPYCNCEKCGTPLKAEDVSGYFNGRHLCTICRFSEHSILIGAYTPPCQICGKPLGVEASTRVGPQICNSCLVAIQLQPSMGQLSSSP